MREVVFNKIPDFSVMEPAAGEIPEIVGADVG